MSKFFMSNSSMLQPCDGCRYSPATYPGKGYLGERVDQVSDGGFDWENSCSRGHSVSITWVWNEDHERVIYMFRLPFWTECGDREEPYDGPRVSRYSREPVI